jgi:tetratricopeptide (TPR) repeat protein
MIIRVRPIINLAVLLLFMPVSLLAQRLPEENYILGYVCYQHEKYDSAIVYFNRSLAKNDKNTDALYYRGLSFMNNGEFDRAIDDFKTVDKAEPGKGAIWEARIYARQNNVDAALTALDLHLKSNYRLPESTILLDKDLSSLENNRKWTDFWKNASYYTGFDKAMAEADYLIKSGDYIEAADALSEGMKGNYRKSPLYARRAEVYLKTGNKKQALEDLNAAISGDSRNATLYEQRGDLNYSLEKYKDAQADYESALKYNAGNFGLYPKRALAESKNGLYDEAVKDMEFYLGYFKDDHKNWYNYGTINRENHKYFDALSCFNKALSFSKAEPLYFLARGETYMDTHTYKYARNDFSMALDLDPRNAQAYFDLGQAAVQLDDRNNACYGFSKAYEYGIFEAKEYMDKYCK